MQKRYRRQFMRGAISANEARRRQQAARRLPARPQPPKNPGCAMMQAGCGMVILAVVGMFLFILFAMAAANL